MAHVFTDDFLKETISLAIKAEPPGQYSLLRHAMYLQLTNRLKEHDGADRRCLSISSSNGLAKICGLRSVAFIAADYPAVTITDLPYADDEFDFCVSDQVLEHVEGDPFLAFSESMRVLKPGGIAVHTTCFINPVHGVPRDFWRFSLDALRLLASACNAEVMECGGWGNWEAWKLVQLGFRFVPVPMNPDHPVYKIAVQNDPTVPISTWIIVRKK
jgi:SAM-dependent methyltransferase